MGIGEMYYDITAVLFTAFNVFFVWLVIYLHREGKREGFPYRSDGVVDSYEAGLGGMPDPKTYRLAHGQGAVSYTHLTLTTTTIV